MTTKPKHFLDHVFGHRYVVPELKLPTVTTPEVRTTADLHIHQQSKAAIERVKQREIGKKLKQEQDKEYE